MSIPGSGERKPVVMLTSSIVCVLCFTVLFLFLCSFVAVSLFDLALFFQTLFSCISICFLSLLFLLLLLSYVVPLRSLLSILPSLLFCSLLFLSAFFLLYFVRLPLSVFFPLFTLSPKCFCHLFSSFSPLPWFGFSFGFYSQRTQAFLGNGRCASRWHETCPSPDWNGSIDGVHLLSKPSRMKMMSSCQGNGAVFKFKEYFQFGPWMFLQFCNQAWSLSNLNSYWSLIFLMCLWFLCLFFTLFYFSYFSYFFEF